MPLDWGCSCLNSHASEFPQRMEGSGLFKPFSFKMGLINPKNKFARVDAKTHYLKQNILISQYF